MLGAPTREEVGFLFQNDESETSSEKRVPPFIRELIHDRRSQTEAGGSRTQREELDEGRGARITSRTAINTYNSYNGLYTPEERQRIKERIYGSGESRESSSVRRKAPPFIEGSLEKEIRARKLLEKDESGSEKPLKARLELSSERSDRGWKEERSLREMIR